MNPALLPQGESSMTDHDLEEFKLQERALCWASSGGRLSTREVAFVNSEFVKCAKERDELRTAKEAAEAERDRLQRRWDDANGFTIARDEYCYKCGVRLIWKASEEKT
jgi:hypothetical protein